MYHRSDTSFFYSNPGLHWVLPVAGLQSSPVLRFPQLGTTPVSADKAVLRVGGRASCLECVIIRLVLL
jgi:hypothetical protein